MGKKFSGINRCTKIKAVQRRSRMRRVDGPSMDYHTISAQCRSRSVAGHLEPGANACNRRGCTGLTTQCEATKNVSHTAERDQGPPNFKSGALLAPRAGFPEQCWQSALWVR